MAIEFRRVDSRDPSQSLPLSEALLCFWWELCYLRNIDVECTFLTQHPGLWVGFWGVLASVAPRLQLGVPDSSSDSASFVMNDQLPCQLGGHCREKRKRFIAIIYETLWCVWKARNDKIFNKRTTSPTKTADCIINTVLNWVNYRGNMGNCIWTDRNDNVGTLQF
ncbi:hypothetical protein LXL04_011564 [Taraxacum kok-saghyz]